MNFLSKWLQLFKLAKTFCVIIKSTYQNFSTFNFYSLMNKSFDVSISLILTMMSVLLDICLKTQLNVEARRTMLKYSKV